MRLDPTVPGLDPGVLSGLARQVAGCAEQWREQTARLRLVGVAGVLEGPCGRALMTARDRLLAELASVQGELEVRAAELRAAELRAGELRAGRGAA